MKTTFFIIALALGFSAFPQKTDSEEILSTDKIEKTVITKTTVKSSLGEDVSIKKAKISSKEALALEQDGTTNQSVNRRPLYTIKKAVFLSEGDEYLVEPDPKGYLVYTLENGEKRDYGKIRKTSQPNAYLMITDEGTAFGHFNEKGNFVVESYNPDQDKIVVRNFILSEEALEQLEDLRD